MKTEEKVKVKVRPEYFTTKDEEFVKSFNILCDRYLIFDIEMKKLVRVDDIYKDKTTFYKTLLKGEGSASPYPDTVILCKLLLIDQF
jgi:hypothetical protein